MPFQNIIKRDGTEVPFKIEKISSAIEKAFVADGGQLNHNSDELAEAVVLFLEKKQIQKPHIEEIQDMVETVLANLGYARVGLVYKKFREKRRLARGRLFIEDDPPEDYQEIYNPVIQVKSLSKQSVSPWDVRVIQKKLMDECDIPIDVAREIASSVEKKIISLDFSIITTELIREFTNNILAEYKFDDIVLKQTRAGIPFGDIDNLFHNSHVDVEQNNPEKIRSLVATHSLKQFALKKIYSDEVAKAHNSGRIHIHGLGSPLAMMSGVFSLRQIASEGIQMLGLKTRSKPAKHARVLTTHLNTTLACMRPYYYGPLSLCYLNFYFAPFLENLSEEQILQEAQNLIFITSQNAFARGGEPLAIDFNLYTYVPDNLKREMAIGPGGIETNKTYSEYAETAFKFLSAILKCLEMGDAENNSFDYPVISVHYLENFKLRAEEVRLLQSASKVAVARKNINFIKDRSGKHSHSSITHLVDSMKSPTSKKSGLMRINNLQTISINLPRFILSGADYRNNVEIFDLITELDDILQIAWQAHEEKRAFMLSLTDKNSSLQEINKLMSDGYSQVDIRNAKCCISFVGLEELVFLAKGQQIIQHGRGFKFAMDFIHHFWKFSQEMGMFLDRIEIEENPELVAAFRLARRDFEQFDQAREIFKAKKPHEIRYSNGFNLNVGDKISLEMQVDYQRKFHEHLGIMPPSLKSEGSGNSWHQIYNLL